MVDFIAGSIMRQPVVTTVDPDATYIPIVTDSGHIIRRITPNNLILQAGGVDGPSSATDNAVARFDGTTGKLIQNSAATIADTTGALSIAGTSNQFVLGTTNTTTISASAPAASRVITFADPLGNDSVAYLAATQSLTNKTLNGGTNTIGAAINTDNKRTSGAVTANGTITYANVTGLSTTVVPGTYKFECILPSTVASGTGGIKYAFNYTTTALTSIESTAMGYTASAVAVQHTTTTTTQTDLFTQAAVVILTIIKGTMVVSTGGTVDVQVAQNTSNGSNTVALVGGTMEFTRIA